VIVNAVTASATRPARRVKGDLPLPFGRSTPSRCAIDGPFSCSYMSRWSLNFPGSRHLGYAEQGVNLRIGTAEPQRVHQGGSVHYATTRQDTVSRYAGSVP